MSTVAEAVAAVEAEQQKRAKAAEQFDKYKKFLASKAWRASRWKYMCSQAKPLRCAACGATARDTRLAIDHVQPLRTPQGWLRRLDPTNYQILCAVECNWLGKGSTDTDLRTDKIEAALC